MKTLSEGDLLPKIIEAYSRPTRIVRGKDATNDLEVPLNFGNMSCDLCFCIYKTIFTLLINPFLSKQFQTLMTIKLSRRG